VNPQTNTSAMGATPRTDRSPPELDTRSHRMTPWASRSGLRIVIAIAVAVGLVAAGAQVASAQGKRRRTAQRKEPREAKVPAAGAKKSGRDKSKVKKEQRFDFTGFELAGSVRMPQLLYFLDRAEEELERASLERRTFVPEMLKSLDEENL
jgi:hypothetical protein